MRSDKLLVSKIKAMVWYHCESISQILLLSMKFLASFVLQLALLPGFALANTHVCIDQQGKKSFSESVCEQQGLQSATADFPVDSIQPVYVVGSLGASKAEAAAEAAARPKSVYGSLKWLAWLIIGAMPVAAVFFLGSNVVMFIKKRYRKFVHVKTSMSEERK
jgi:hypothetical protein